MMIELSDHAAGFRIKSCPISTFSSKVGLRVLFPASVGSLRCLLGTPPIGRLFRPRRSLKPDAFNQKRERRPGGRRSQQRSLWSQSVRLRIQSPVFMSLA
jgi:hypothetical protein